MQTVSPKTKAVTCQAVAKTLSQLTQTESSQMTSTPEPTIDRISLCNFDSYGAKPKVPMTEVNAKKPRSHKKPVLIDGEQYFGFGALPHKTKKVLIEELPAQGPTVTSQPAKYTKLPIQESLKSFVTSLWSEECEQLDIDNHVPMLTHPDPDTVSLRPTSPLVEDAKRVTPKKAKKPRKFHFQTRPGRATRCYNNDALLYTPNFHGAKPKQ